MDIKFKKLIENAVIPYYAHDGDVGMDFTCTSIEYDEKNDLYVFHTGLAFESDFEIGQFLFPRSSNRKTDAYLCNSVGIADSAIYRGEIMFCYKNRDSVETIAMRDFFKAFMSSPINDFYNMKIAMQKTYEEVLLKHKNLEYAPYKVGDRIGQMVFLNTPKVVLHECSELSDSDRGVNGFGSTGN